MTKSSNSEMEGGGYVVARKDWVTASSRGEEETGWLSETERGDWVAEGDRAGDGVVREARERENQRLGMRMEAR